MSEQMTTAARRATCEACTLAEVMKDCPLCQFDAGEYPKATSKDVFDMYRRLWGHAPDGYVYNQYQIAQAGGRELLDLTQGCKHKRGTVCEWETYPATREEPGETVGKLFCNDCGEAFELGYQPEDMELRWIEGAEYLEN